MTALFDTLVSSLGLPADGINTGADVGNKCLWSCAWRALTPGDRATGLTPATYNPDDILPLELATQAQLSAELADTAAAWGYTLPEAQWGLDKITSEATRLKALVDAGDFYDDARRFLGGLSSFGLVREYGLSFRTYVLPTLWPNWSSNYAGQQRPGWEV